MRSPVVPLLSVALAACGASQVVTPPPPPPEVPRSVTSQKATSDAPPSRREDVVETLHGVEVHDPYRWLEDPSKPEVKGWIAAEDAYGRAHLAGLAGRAAIAERLPRLFYFDSIGAPQVRNGRLFYERRHKDREKGIVYWREGEKGSETVLLDPNAWASDGSASVHGYWPSWDGRYLAYNESIHNSDEATMKVIEVATGKVLPEEVAGTRLSGASWTPDGKGFYYSQTPPASATVPEAQRNAHTVVRYHHLGSPTDGDKVIRKESGHAELFVRVFASEDGHWLFTTVRHGSSGSKDIYFKDARKPSKDWSALVSGVDASFDVDDYRDRFYVSTNDGASRWHLFVVDPRSPARAAWKEIVPESEATLENVAILGGRLVLAYLRNAASEVEVHDLAGKLLRKLDLPPLGTVGGLVGRPDEDTAYFTYTSYTQPPVIAKTSIKSGKVEEWARIELPIDLGRYLTEQVRYPSKDGTEVTMFLVHKKDAEKNGQNPTLLTGYGGFQVSITPTFSSAYAAWLEMGGMLAVPNLRGGGEYGETWHRAGMMDKKQNVFDDFIGAARYLESSGWTSPEKLAIYGGSNGGLLTGAATVQAPELFAAVLCAVPLLDMVRYHKFGLGTAWTTEYGSADEDSQFPALFAYSPYHHVREGVTYPPVLMLSSDHDDRVDPMHARKFTAALQAAGASVWLRVEQNAGHGGADVVRQRIDQWADMLAFLAAELHM